MFLLRLLCPACSPVIVIFRHPMEWLKTWIKDNTILITKGTIPPIVCLLICHKILTRNGGYLSLVPWRQCYASESLVRRHWTWYEPGVSAMFIKYISLLYIVKFKNSLYLSFFLNLERDCVGSSLQLCVGGDSCGSHLWHQCPSHLFPVQHFEFLGPPYCLSVII